MYHLDLPSSSKIHPVFTFLNWTFFMVFLLSTRSHLNLSHLKMMYQIPHCLHQSLKVTLLLLLCMKKWIIFLNNFRILSWKRKGKMERGFLKFRKEMKCLMTYTSQVIRLSKLYLGNNNLGTRYISHAKFTRHPSPSFDSLDSFSNTPDPTTLPQAPARFDSPLHTRGPHANDLLPSISNPSSPFLHSQLQNSNWASLSPNPITY